MTDTVTDTELALLGRPRCDCGKWRHGRLPLSQSEHQDAAWALAEAGRGCGGECPEAWAATLEIELVELWDNFVGEPVPDYGRAALPGLIDA